MYFLSFFSKFLELVLLSYAVTIMPLFMLLPHGTVSQLSTRHPTLMTFQLYTFFSCRLLSMLGCVIILAFNTMFSSNDFVSGCNASCFCTYIWLTTRLRILLRDSKRPQMIRIAVTCKLEIKVKNTHSCNVSFITRTHRFSVKSCKYHLAEKTRLNRQMVEEIATA